MKKLTLVGLVFSLLTILAYAGATKYLDGDAIRSADHTKTWTPPSTSQTLVGRTSSDTLTNKTLTTPVISSISNTGTLTLPTSSDTLVGRATTDTLTNKTLTSPTLTTPAIGAATGTSLTLTGALTTGVATSNDGSVIFKNSINSNNAILSSVQPSSSYTFYLPDTVGSSGQVFTSAAGASANTWTTATNANTASAIVKRDGSGNFTAGTITANLTGTASSVTTNANLTGPVTSVGNATAIANGAITQAMTGATATPTASTTAGWDANLNFSGNIFQPKYATTATAAGTTTLTVASKGVQYFTGSTTQTVALPAVSTLSTDPQWGLTIVNLSSGAVTVQSSGGNTVQAMAANTKLVLRCISTSGTGTASWDWDYSAVQNSLSGGGSVTSVALTVPGILSISGSPVTTSGTLAIGATGASGGIPYFSSSTALASSAALTQYGVVYGGGAGATPVSTANGTTGQVFGATSSAAPGWTSKPGPFTQSEVFMMNGNGHGSTNTLIRRYTNAQVNTGSDITYADSAGSGASFTINTTGMYIISVSDVYGGGQSNPGISVNSASLSTNIYSLSYANGFRGACNSSTAGYFCEVNIFLYLTATDVVREQDDGALNDTSTRSWFHIARIW